MNIIKHLDGIYEVEDFLTEEQQNIFLSEARETDGWETTHVGNTVKVMSELAKAELNKVFIEVESFFPNLKTLINTNHLRRLQHGEFMTPHVDAGYEGETKDIMFGVVIYLNDDFRGGQLIYPELGKVITPKARSMVVHDATFNHQVYPAIDGDRYSITTFIIGDESTRFRH